jgi:tetratricopeptide (TPR) repeat protein
LTKINIFKKAITFQFKPYITLQTKYEAPHSFLPNAGPLVEFSPPKINRMRKSTILSTLLLFGLIVYGQSGEEENIKKAIKARSDANRSRNLEAWLATWHHDVQASNTFIAKGGYGVTQSWDSLKAEAERDIKANPKPDNSTQLKLDNFSIRSDGNLAIADYDATITSASDQSSIFPYEGARKLRCHDVLIKENGQWKTHSRIITVPSTYNLGGHDAEVDLNNAGYELLAAKKIKQAIEVFKLNVKLHPDSWNVYDSLGEANAADGNKKDAIANYEKSIQLNPNSEAGKEILAKLKQK